jgi:hypothetical protein
VLSFGGRKTAHYHSRSYEFGDFEQKKKRNTTVLPAKNQQVVVLRVKANIWNGIKRLTKKCSAIERKYNRVGSPQLVPILL